MAIIIIVIVWSMTTQNPRNGKTVPANSTIPLYFDAIRHKLAWLRRALFHSTGVSSIRDMPVKRAALSVNRAAPAHHRVRPQSALTAANLRVDPNRTVQATETVMVGMGIVMLDAADHPPQQVGQHWQRALPRKRLRSVPPKCPRRTRLRTPLRARRRIAATQAQWSQAALELHLESWFLTNATRHVGGCSMLGGSGAVPRISSCPSRVHPCPI